VGTMKGTVFWNVTCGSLEEIDWCFSKTSVNLYCATQVTSQKTALFILIEFIIVFSHSWTTSRIGT
jgi:hypothetical protein